MIKIQYQILRYLPDRVSGEFINLGVVAFDPESQVLKSRFITRVGKLSTFFSNLNSRYLIKSVKVIHEQLASVSNQVKAELQFARVQKLETITESILPKDDSALVFSEVKKTLDIHVEATINDLFFRLVKVELDDDEDDEVRKDKEVWSKVYKRHFDEYGVSQYFHPHVIKTQNDEVVFDKTWKNGALNCFEAVSFNLSRPDIIKNKVYKWVGKLEELNSSDEPLNIYLLSILPNEHPELTSFINTKISSKSTSNTKVHIISEENVDDIAKNIKRQIEEHS
jgi:hypothetical protein